MVFRSQLDYFMRLEFKAVVYAVHLYVRIYVGTMAMCIRIHIGTLWSRICKYLDKQIMQKKETIGDSDEVFKSSCIEDKTRKLSGIAVQFETLQANERVTACTKKNEPTCVPRDFRLGGFFCARAPEILYVVSIL